LRLDGIASVEDSQRMFRSRRCLIKLQSDTSDVAFAAVKITSAEVSFDDFIARLTESVAAAAWSEGSYDEAAMGGLRKILGDQHARQQATGEALDVALTDLESLRKRAQEAVAAARIVANHAASAPSVSGYPDGTSAGGAEDDGLRRLLEDFGCLLGPDGKPVAKGGSSRADVKADVARVCVAALEKRRQGGGGLGAMLLAHDAYCLVNRARGTALVSPEEVMAALRSCSASGGPLMLRNLGSTGAISVCLARSGDDASTDDRRLVELTKESPVSACSLSRELGLSTSEARYLLRDAEQRALLVRDEAPEGVFYYKNFFDEYI